jgi:hypothetical protein
VTPKIIAKTSLREAKGKKVSYGILLRSGGRNGENQWTADTHTSLRTETESMVRYHSRLAVEHKLAGS